MQKEQDHVDTVLAQWLQERPDLDVSPMGVISRITRSANYLGRALQGTFAAFQLHTGEFDVLATLRRAGPPYCLNPTDLFNMLMVSSGGMTSRLDRLERDGLIKRSPDPEDRRGTLVSLTARGLEVVDTALSAHLATERRLLSGLTQEEQQSLALLLRKLLLSFNEGKPGGAAE